jgi:hypothetical protein
MTVHVCFRSSLVYAACCSSHSLPAPRTRASGSESKTLRAVSGGGAPGFDALVSFAAWKILEEEEKFTIEHRYLEDGPTTVQAITQGRPRSASTSPSMSASRRWRPVRTSSISWEPSA